MGEERELHHVIGFGGGAREGVAAEAAMRRGEEVGGGAEVGFRGD